MVKRSKLQIDYEYDFRVVGLIAAIKEYKLAWALNKQLHWRFIKEADHVLDFKADQRLVISHFAYLREHTGFRLLKNRAVEHTGQSRPFLIPERKNYDYWLLVYGDPLPSEFTALLEDLNHINWIQYCKEEPLEDLRSKDNLII
ncbi:MAG TPA: IPExxxVDY family protein [Cytophagales bacterium]|nr:IPExxxVDY family protein [Cytophagales bacterium]